MSKSDNKTISEEPFRLGFRNVVRLGYVSLFTDVSTEMILGVLPLFIVKDLGASAFILGLIEGFAEAVNYLCRVVTGVLTDRFARRKPFVLIGYGLSSVAKPFFAVASSWGQALAVRVIDRAGKGTRTSPRDALISDSISKSESGKGFGLHRSMDQIGAVAGPALAFVAIPLIGVRGVFWLSFVPAAIALFILLFFVKEARGLTKQKSVFENARAVLTREFIVLLAVLGIFGIGAYNFSFILLKAYTLGIPEQIIPLVYAALNLSTVVLGLPSGILADKIGKIPVLFLSYIFFLLTSMAALLLSGYAPYAFLIAFLFGSYLASSETVQRAMIPDFTKPEHKGTAYAIYYALIGCSSLLANSVFGLLWTNISPSAAFQYSAITSVFGLLALLALMIGTNKTKTSSHPS